MFVGGLPNKNIKVVYPALGEMKFSIEANMNNSYHSEYSTRVHHIFW